MKTLDELIEQGYAVDFNAHWSMTDDDNNPQKWYCVLYIGDPNGPHKPGTVIGSGYGMTQDEALNKAQLNLHCPEVINLETSKIKNQLKKAIAFAKARISW